jgi:capsular polysaccharide transport system permease protein
MQFRLPFGNRGTNTTHRYNSPAQLVRYIFSEHDRSNFHDSVAKANTAMQLTNSESFDLWSAVKRQRRVLFALMLRNIRTRFLGHGLGYLIAIAWPLSHIVILVAIYGFVGRAAPYGDSIILFVGTGVVPFMTFGYLARFMMLSVIKARPLLAFPEVKVLDVLLASALLEILAASCVTIVLIILAWFIGIDVLPRDIVQASYAFGAAILLGLGFGLLNGVIALAAPMWMTGFALVYILLWATAGVLFVPDSLPEFLREVLAYHPLLQVIEWMRSAYYEGYGNLLLDRSYAVGFGVLTVFLGLLFERAMRGYVLAKR